MLNEDIKKLLIELNLDHHEQALEQAARIQPEARSHELEESPEREASLQKQIQACNAILKKRWFLRKRVLGAALTLAAWLLWL